MEFLQEAIVWYNLPLTVLMGVLVLYWLMVSIGIFDADSFSSVFEVDADVDVDVDVDLDVHADADVGMHDAIADIDVDAHHDVDHHGLSAGMVVLRFLNFGQVPAMVVFSVLAVSLWTISMIGNHYLNPFGTFFGALVLFVGNLFVSALITKAVTTPLKPLMRALNKDYDTHEPIVGRECKVRSMSVDEKGGQAEVERKGATFLINVRVSKGQEAIPKGAAALVVHHDAEKDIYVIRTLSAEESKKEENK